MARPAGNDFELSWPSIDRPVSAKGAVHVVEGHIAIFYGGWDRRQCRTVWVNCSIVIDLRSCVPRVGILALAW